MMTNVMTNYLEQDAARLQDALDEALWRLENNPANTAAAEELKDAVNAVLADINVVLARYDLENEKEPVKVKRSRLELARRK